MKTDLGSYIDKFKDARILVVGDIILDRYIWGDVTRISPEAPVPVVLVDSRTEMLGGAANVVNNMVSLGARPLLCGVVGEDSAGIDIIKSLEEYGLSTEGIILDKNRVTSEKTRIVARNQQVVRYDIEQTDDIDESVADRILSFIADSLSDIDAVIVSDYGKGVINSYLMERLRKILKGSGIIVAVDPKTGNFEHYKGVDLVTPNHHEAGSYCRFDIKDHDTLLRAGQQMLKELQCGSVLITQGKDGMTLFESNGRYTHISTVAKKVFDVTGAGDTVISTFCLGLVSGLDMKFSAILSNFAAGIVVGEVGTTSVSADALKKAVASCGDRPVWHDLNAG